MNNLIIRKALEEDREAIALISARAFNNDWKLLSTDENKIARILAPGVFIDVYDVAIVNQKIVGFISLVTKNERAQYIKEKVFQKEVGFFKGYALAMMLKKEFEEPLHFNADQVYVDILGVDPDFNHQGIGSQLLQHTIENNKQKEISLKVTCINENAINCYTKKGFHEFKREKVKYPKQMGFDEFIYMKR